MQLLIVHHEAEIGQALRGMVREYTAHTAEFVALDGAALEWAGAMRGVRSARHPARERGRGRAHPRGSLGERSPRLHTFFLPAYPLAAQRLEVANTKIFPEPIDGERLLQAIERVAEARAQRISSHHRSPPDVLSERQRRRRAIVRRTGNGRRLFAQRRVAPCRDGAVARAGGALRNAALGLCGVCLRRECELGRANNRHLLVRRLDRGW
jgi:hypothetical protein